MPELWGGSADLAESNNTTMEGADSFGPTSIATKSWNAQPYGRTLHVGIREHAMGSILNGIALHGPTRPYGGTFLVFSDYMRGAVRLGSLMKSAVIYVWTHDSIGLGEDGPTHQPIEHMAALRPGDANETAAGWKATLARPEGPVGMALSRQNLPVLAGTSTEGVAKGGYVLADASSGTPEVILIATGSELQLAVEAREALEADGVPTRVVSMPCSSAFDRQSNAYQELILPLELPGVAIEAAHPDFWRKYVGRHGAVIGMTTFGESAPASDLYTHFGITVQRVVDAVRALMPRAQHRHHETSLPDQIVPSNN